MNNRPIVIITISYIIGILLGLYLKINIALFVLCGLVILCAMIFVFLKYDQNKVKLNDMNKGLIIICLITVVLSYNNIKNSEYEYTYISDNVVGERKFSGKIISVEKNSEFYSNYIIKINDEKLNRNYRVFLKIKKRQNENITYNYGDYITGIGEFTRPEVRRNYKGYDYSEYLKTKKVSVICQTDINKIKTKENNSHIAINVWIMNLRNKLKSNLIKILNKDKSDIAIALLLGDSSYINENQKEMYSKANVSHILAISGMHVNYIVAALGILQKKIDNRKGKILLIIFLIFFALLTGSSPSVIRAVIMCALATSSKLFYRKSDTINNISIACLSILIFNPYNILNLGFQLSFLGTLGIILFNDSVKGFLEFFIKINKDTRHTVILKVIERVISITSVSISANIFIMPILIYNFNTISLNFLISCILTAPILGVMLACGYIVVIISAFFTDISKYFSVIFEFLLDIFIKMSEICSSFNFLRFNIITPSVFIMFFYYFIVIYFGYYRKKINFKISIKITKVILVFLLIIIFVIKVILSINSTFQIYFVDVGQGDCTLIVTNTNKKILIDGGGSDSYDVGKNVLVPYLYDRKIDYVDYIIISHFDTDHVGGLLTVMEKMKVGTVVISKQGKDSQNYERFKEIVKYKKIKVLVVKKGDRLRIDKDVYFDILWPNNSNIINENILNNNSIVCKMQYKNISMLFTGDIEEIAEKQIVQEYQINCKIINSTILKVGHHGSKTSTTQEFLELVKPKIALIGVGKNNKFGHPNDDVIDRIKNMRC